MKTALAALQTELYTKNAHRPADLYTFNLPGGPYYWTSASLPVVSGGFTYTTGPGLKRGRVRTTARLEVATLDINIVPNGVLVAGIPMMQAAVRGYFRNAGFTLNRAFFGSTGQIIGTEVVFGGFLVDVCPGTTELVVTARSAVAMIDSPLPRRLIQSQCPYVVYDTNTCKAVAASFTDAAKTVAGGTTAQVIQLSAASTQAVPGSIITVTSGAQNGAKVQVQSVVGTAVTLTEPMSAVLATGVTLSIVRGCDKTRNTCKNVFNNMVRFGGLPDAPREG